MRETLEERINQLWGCVVKSYEIDVLRNRIVFNMFLNDETCPREFNVTFEGVSSFFYGYRSGEERFEIVEPDEEEWGFFVFEVHAVYYYEEGTRDLISITSEGGTSEYRSRPNFVFDLMFDTIISVEAKSIIINGEKFDNLV